MKSKEVAQKVRSLIEHFEAQKPDIRKMVDYQKVLVLNALRTYLGTLCPKCYGSDYKPFVEVPEDETKITPTPTKNICNKCNTKFKMV
jgi:hypothetical protein